MYHKGFVADRRNSEVNEFTRINGASARRGSVARQRVRQHAESLAQIKKTHDFVSLFGGP